MENSCKKGQHGRTSYGLGRQEMAVRGCKSWIPWWGNPIHCVLIFNLLLFTNKKVKFSAIFCSLVKTYFSVFLILSLQSHTVGLHPFSPPGSPAARRLVCSKVQRSAGSEHWRACVTCRAWPHCQYLGPRHASWLCHTPPPKKEFHLVQATKAFFFLSQETSKAMNCSYQPVSLPGWGHAPRACSRGHAGLAELPADGGCTWRSESSWRGGSNRSLHSAAWRHKPGKQQPRERGA